MPKMKTHKASKKRFRVTATGLLKRSQAGKKHLNSHKTSKRKGQLRKPLVDGGKLVFERPEPDHGLISGLWTLLPTTTRTALWPATYAFGNALQFDAVVVPRAERERYPGYTTEEQAADYPPGRYEMQLQTAAWKSPRLEECGT